MKRKIEKREQQRFPLNSVFMRNIMSLNLLRVLCYIRVEVYWHITHRRIKMLCLRNLQRAWKHMSYVVLHVTLLLFIESIYTFETIARVEFYRILALALLWFHWKALLAYTLCISGYSCLSLFLYENCTFSCTQYLHRLVNVIILVLIFSLLSFSCGCVLYFKHILFYSPLHLFWFFVHLFLHFFSFHSLDLSCIRFTCVVYTCTVHIHKHFIYSFAQRSMVFINVLIFLLFFFYFFFFYFSFI